MQPSFTRADGRHDVIENIALSGEPLIPEIRPLFANGPPEPILVPEFYNNTLRLQDFRARYQAYWNSTAKKSKTGKSGVLYLSPISLGEGLQTVKHGLTGAQVVLWMLLSFQWHLTRQ